MVSTLLLLRLQPRTPEALPGMQAAEHLPAVLQQRTPMQLVQRSTVSRALTIPEALPDPSSACRVQAHNSVALINNLCHAGGNRSRLCLVLRFSHHQHSRPPGLLGCFLAAQRTASTRMLRRTPSTRSRASLTASPCLAHPSADPSTQARLTPCSSPSISTTSSPTHTTSYSSSGHSFSRINKLGRLSSVRHSSMLRHSLTSMLQGPHRAWHHSKRGIGRQCSSPSIGPHSKVSHPTRGMRRSRHKRPLDCSRARQHSSPSTALRSRVNPLSRAMCQAAFSQDMHSS